MSNFADDTKLYLEINSFEDTQKLQNSIDDFAQWCVENDLDVNEQKCHVMTVTRKNNPLVANYTLNGKILNRVQEHKDLGIIVDSGNNENTLYEPSTIAYRLCKRSIYTKLHNTNQTN